MMKFLFGSKLRREQVKVALVFTCFNVLVFALLGLRFSGNVDGEMTAATRFYQILIVVGHMPSLVWMVLLPLALGAFCGRAAFGFGGWRLCSFRF